MRKLLIIITLLFGFMASGSAAGLTAAQQKEVIARINTAASNLKSMSCSFVQTKHLSLLSDKMVSKGTMHYKQPNKLNWQYTAPYDYRFIFNGTKVYVGNKSKKDVIDTNTNKMFREIARIMMNTVTGKALSNAADFTVSVAANNASWIVTLVPKKKEMRSMFARIELVFTKSNTMISEINIFEKNNDRTNIKLSNIVNNGPVKDSYFAIP